MIYIIWECLKDGWRGFIFGLSRKLFCKNLYIDSWGLELCELQPIFGKCEALVYYEDCDKDNCPFRKENKYVVR